MKLLIVYNICGISGLETFEFYQPAVESILVQSVVASGDADVVISGCMISQGVKDLLYAEYVDKGVKFCWIDQKEPVPVSFNKTCRELDKLSGPYDGFLYIDSGIIFNHHEDIEKMTQTFESGPYAMVASRVDHDDGAFQWFGWGKHINDFSEHDLHFQEDFVMPLGTAWNLHCQIFSRELLDVYGNPYTDIFKGHCSESVFTFKCAALNKHWVINKDVIVHHRYIHGNASSIENPSTLTACPNWNHPYKIKSVIDVMKAGQPLGLGYEECSKDHGVFHDPNLYTPEGFAKKPELAEFIKRYLFLQKDELDYDTIKCEVV